MPDINIIILIGVVGLLGGAVLVASWRVARRVSDLQRRLAIEEAGRRSLDDRLGAASALFESRLLRLEGVKGAAGSRAKQRRRAVQLLDRGGDPMAIASRCGLPMAELDLLIQLDSLRVGGRQRLAS